MRFKKFTVALLSISFLTYPAPSKNLIKQAATLAHATAIADGAQQLSRSALPATCANCVLRMHGPRIQENSFNGVPFRIIRLSCKAFRDGDNIIVEPKKTVTNMSPCKPPSRDILDNLSGSSTERIIIPLEIFIAMKKSGMCPAVIVDVQGRPVPKQI